MRKITIFKAGLLLSFLMIFNTILAIPVRAQTATLYFYPATYSAGVGSTFSIAVMVETGGEDVSGVTADFTYPSDGLEVVSIDSSGSVFGVEAEGTYGAGVVYVSRASSGGSSYNGDGEVVTVNFRALSEGTYTLSFTDDAVVTTSGAAPEDILGSTGTATITAGDVPDTGFFDEVDIKISYGIAFVLTGLLGYLVLVYIQTAIYEQRKKR